MLNGWVNYLFGENNTGNDANTGTQPQQVINDASTNDDDWIMVQKESPQKQPRVPSGRSSPVIVAEMKVESIDGSVGDETELMDVNDNTTKKHKLPRVGSCPNGLSQTAVAVAHVGGARNKKVRVTHNNDRAHVAHVMFSTPSGTHAPELPARAPSPSLATRRIRRANVTHNAGPARPMSRKTKQSLLNSGRSNDRKCQTHY